MRVPSLSNITSEAFLVLSVLSLTFLNVLLSSTPRAHPVLMCLRGSGLYCLSVGVKKSKHQALLCLCTTFMDIFHEYNVQAHLSQYLIVIDNYSE